MEILDKEISLEELNDIASNGFGDMVKAVVDIHNKLLAIDAELYSDLEALLLNNGSKQEGLWGINLYPTLGGENFVEFDSMINMRPSQGNMSRGVDDSTIQEKFIQVVEKWVKR